jgi:hypothetical protein
VTAPWATPEDVPNKDRYDEAELVEYLQFASDVLYGLSGSQWPGEQADKIWPGSRRRAGGPRHRHTTVSPTIGSYPAGGYVVVGCGCSHDEFGCHRVPELHLPGRPVIDVVEVVIDGNPLDADRYEVQDGFRLVRLADSDGHNEGWPCCQRADLDDGAIGTWSVEYGFGTAPPVGGKLSCVSLGTELLKAKTGDKECRLPKRVTAITRQGVTVAVLDPLSLFKDGLTGLSDVDLWLGSLKASKGRKTAVFANPESLLRHGHRRRPGSFAS